ncbi:MAG: cell division protein SepF [Acidimicrobiaceae bacterium]|nr:cell division protein SepF [Acidimicrobiaceae bacterium]
MLKKALFYLGLGSDEEYEHYDDRVTGGAFQPGAEAVPTAATARHDLRQGPGSTTVRPIMPSDSMDQPVRPVAPVDPAHAGADADGRARSAAAGVSAVRIVDDPPTRPSTTNPHSASPTVFEEAPRIGERLKAGQPVIMNLQNADRNTRRRLLDFASGACYALEARMERVAEQVFLITPPEPRARPASESSPEDESYNL